MIVAKNKKVYLNLLTFSTWKIYHGFGAEVVSADLYNIKWFLQHNL